MLSSKEYREKIAFKKTIEDVLDNDLPAGSRKLFAEMYLIDSPSFLGSIIEVAACDSLYLQYAPEKWLSKMGAVPYAITNDEAVIPSSVAVLSTLASGILAMYKDNWDKIFTTYFESDYAPLENYDMTQKATYNSNETHTGDDTITMMGKEFDIKAGQEIAKKQGKEFSIKAGQEISKKQGKEFDIKSGKEINKKEGAESTVYGSDTENQVSAFNSIEYQDATKAMHKGADYINYGNIVSGDTTTPAERKDTLEYGTGVDERKDTHEYGTGNDERKDILEYGTGANERKDTHEFGTGDDARKDETTYNSTMSHGGYDELTRHGNIGVTTSQQMLQSELDVRQYNFLMQVFRDVTDFLGLPIY